MSRETAKKVNSSILSIDVEDGLNILMRDLFSIEMPPTERVIKNVNIILNLLSKNNTKGTFFILGEIASAYPKLIKSISLSGHEVAVHGYHHDQIFKMDRKKAEKDISLAKSLIEDITGNRVYGFRAPAFSISKDTSWAFDLLFELGFKYDSSIMPAKVGRYGWPGFNMEIHRLILPEGNSLIEIPMSVIPVFGKMIPACGGGYLRYLPYGFTRKAFRSIQKKRPAVIYLHPYELDKEKYPDFFYKARSSAGLKKHMSLMFYRLNKDTVEKKLECLVKEFQLIPIKDLIETLEMNGNIPTNTIDDLL